MNKIKKIHFVGIKGVGMMPLAIIAKEAGIKVTGCDLPEEYISDSPLKRAKIEVFKGFSESHLDDVDLVIATAAHKGLENEEVRAAFAKNIPVWTQAQAVGEFMKGDIFRKKFEGISVTGTHGKTTTTAMVATLLKSVGVDPSYMIGTSDIPSLSYPGHLGRGKYFVVEADEYIAELKYDRTPKFLKQSPRVIILTSIELDHCDVYKNVNEMRESFLKFADKLPRDGFLIACGDDPQVRRMLKDFRGNKFTYGFSKENDFYIRKINTYEDRTFFWVNNKDTEVGEFMINVAGEHNALNALSAIILALQLNFPLLKIKKAIAEFKGSKRRLEYVGRLESGALFYDDYAHHPTEVQKTIETLKRVFPGKKIITVFQPHLYSRTLGLFKEFAACFKGSSEVLLCDIFSSAREMPDSRASSEKLAEEIAKNNQKVRFLPDKNDVVEYIGRKNPGRDTIVITIGAGDIYKVKQGLKFLE